MRNLPIAYGNSCYAKKWPNKTTTFDELCERLKNTTYTTETVEEYPKLSKADRDRAKDRGGFVGGQLKDNRRKRENVVCRSMLTHDADHADKDFIEKFTSGCKYAAALYTTHGHTPENPRVRIIVPFTRNVTPDEFTAIGRYFAEEWGIDQFDECSYRPQQLKPWELDEEAVKQIWAEALTIYRRGEILYLRGDEALEAASEQAAAMESDDREGIVRNYLDTLLPEEWDSMSLYERRNFLTGSEFGGDTHKGTVRRETVSNIEIWCECFGKDASAIKPADSYAIAAIVKKIDGWDKAADNGRASLPIYGRQRIYRRTEN